jgi:hypothetical protein
MAAMRNRNDGGARHVGAGFVAVVDRRVRSGRFSIHNSMEKMSLRRWKD